MPCRDDFYVPQNDSAQFDANQATRAACEMAKLLRFLGFVNELSAATLNWIAEHEKEDAERRAREKEARQVKRLKQSGLGKLTHAEKKALGLKN